MKLIVDGAAGLVTVDEAENLKALSVELHGCSPEQASALLGDRDLGRIEDGHAWLDIGALRAIARPPRSCTWDERFQRAMAYAQSNGWTDPAGDFVRAHLEPSPTDANPASRIRTQPPTGSPDGRSNQGSRSHQGARRLRRRRRRPGAPRRARPRSSSRRCSTCSASSWRARARRPGRLALRYARSQAAAGPAAVLGGGARLAPSLAALVNGTAGHALDYDDIGLGAGHISVAIAPAVFAVAEQVEADGQALIDALVVAYEVAHRLTTMYSDTRLGPYAAGYHKPSVYSVFGAAAGAARLLGLDADATASAFGIAASEAGGLRANFGTMTKPLHAGLANRSGIEAALLAQSGFTASADVLEQRFGWHDVICRGEGDLSVVLDGLGDSYAVEEGLVFKAYPCCGANHYAIDAVIGLLREHGIGEPDVARLDVWLEQRNLNDVLVYPWARTPLEGKFSLPYNMAAALADGEVTVNTFTDEAVDRLPSSATRCTSTRRPTCPPTAPGSGC